MKENFTDTTNARTSEQREVMGQIIKDGVCPFCMEHLPKYHKKPILREGNFWIVTENQYGYTNTKIQLLIIAKTHIEKLEDLPKGAGDELLELSRWAEQEFKVTGGAIAMRFGDTKSSAATVKHLHFQLIEPDIKKLGTNDRVVFPIGKSNLPRTEDGSRVADTQYQDLLEEILNKGKWHHPIHGKKTGERSLRIIGYQMRFLRANGLPATTTRDLQKYNLIHGAIGENIAFMNGARTLRTLEKYGCPQSFWKKWVTKEKCAPFGLRAGDLGPGSYGPAWAKFPKPDGGTFNQIKAMVRLMKNRPMLRTIKITPWIPFYVGSNDPKKNPRRVVVAPCHGWVHAHIDTVNNTFKLTHNQRSADCPVGLQFNMVQYYCMGLMLERVTGIHFEELVYYIEDAHIYEMQIEHAKRLVAQEPRVYPTVKFADDAPTENIFDFRPHHFIVEEYDPHAWFSIPTPV